MSLELLFSFALFGYASGQEKRKDKKPSIDCRSFRRAITRTKPDGADLQSVPAGNQMLKYILKTNIAVYSFFILVLMGADCKSAASGFFQKYTFSVENQENLDSIAQNVWPLTAVADQSELTRAVANWQSSSLCRR